MRASSPSRIELGATQAFVNIPLGLKMAVMTGLGALAFGGEPTAAAADVKPAVVTAKPKADWDKTCTSIRRRAKDIYMGLACVEDGAKYQKMHDGAKIFNGNPEKGWVYAAIIVRGIYKCGYVRDGLLPKMDAPSDVADKCEEFYTSLVKKRYEYFKDYNCPEAERGLEGCRSGTWYSHADEDCVGDYLNGNYATDRPTPLNVRGTGKGGFSMRRPIEIEKAVSYRVQVRQGSEDGRAIVISERGNSPILGWGFAKDECVPAQTEHGNDNRRGGTPTVS